MAEATYQGQGTQDHGKSSTATSSQSAAGRIVDTVSQKARDVAKGASDMANDASETVREWGAAAVGAAGQARDKAQEYANTAAHKAQEYAATAAHKVEGFGEDLTALIRRYPMQALVVGLGLGFLLAKVTRSR